MRHGIERMPVLVVEIAHVLDRVRLAIAVVDDVAGAFQARGDAADLRGGVDRHLRGVVNYHGAVLRIGLDRAVRFQIDVLAPQVVEHCLAFGEILRPTWLVTGGYHHAVRSIAGDEHQHYLRLRRRPRGETELGQARRTIAQLTPVHLGLNLLHRAGVVARSDACARDGELYAPPELPRKSGKIAHCALAGISPKVGCSRIGSGLNASGGISISSAVVPRSSLFEYVTSPMHIAPSFNFSVGKFTGASVFGCHSLPAESRQLSTVTRTMRERPARRAHSHSARFLATSLPPPPASAIRISARWRGQFGSGTSESSLPVLPRSVKVSTDWMKAL